MSNKQNHIMIIYYLFIQFNGKYGEMLVAAAQQYRYQKL